MAQLKIAELFYSIQGEGKYMGVPSVFLRTFGCNFTCGGFGMPKGQLSTERDTIAINAEDIKDYKSLPLVSTGCDSYASWDPRFKHLSPMLSTDTIVDTIMDLLPGHSWQDEHLVITGGEPLLGWQRSYPELLSHEKMKPLKELTFETNGTQELTKDFSKWLIEEWQHNKGYFSLTFSVSPKLSISGEAWEDAIKPEIITQYAKHGFTYLKFVVASKEDIEEAGQAVNEYRKAGFKGPVYLMPCGGVESVYNLNARNVAIEAMNRGWRYSDRLQVPLFKNEWGT
jgi:organic radical activating enzyme